MRLRKLLCAGIAVTIGALLLMILRKEHSEPLPPLFSLVSKDPAGIYDDYGEEMWLVTFSILNKNPLDQPDHHKNDLFIQGSDRIAQIKVGNHWRDVESNEKVILGTVKLAPAEQAKSVLLLPSRANSYRASLNYTGPAPSKILKQFVQSAAFRFPTKIRSRLPRWFWNWLGPYSVGPDGSWRKTVLEIELSPKSLAERPKPTDSHSEGDIR